MSHHADQHECSDQHDHSDQHEHGEHDHEVLVPVLLRLARGAYSQGARRRLAEEGLSDLPSNGAFIVGGMANQGATLSDLVDELGVTKQAASQLVDTLVTRAFLERHSVAGDRRRMNAQLTERGRRAAKAVRAGVLDVDALLADAIGPAQLEGLRAGLHALAHIREDLANSPAAPSTRTVPTGGAMTGAARSLVEAQSRRVFERSGLNRLGQHLAAAHGVQVTEVSQLDLGVFRVDRAAGPSWVARVMPAARGTQWALQDAEVLDLLAAHDYPAERLAVPGPTPDLEGQAVVVTEFVEPVARQHRRDAIRAAGGYTKLGDLLGTLHCLADADRFTGRPGGAWHHLTDGGPRQELDAATRLLAAAGEGSTSDAERQLFTRMTAALDAQDDGQGLPSALVHPDFVMANVVASKHGDMVLVDWTGAGWAPRAWSLAFLLWSAGAEDMARVGRVANGYRAHVELQPDELKRLPAMVRTRALVLGAWELALGRKSWAEMDQLLSGAEEVAAAVSAHALDAFKH